MKSPGILASSRFRGQGGEPPEDHPGKTYLEANAKFFYDFTLLTGEGAISNGNAGLEDQGPGTTPAVIVGTPNVRNIIVNTITVPTVGVTGTNAISINSTGAGIFDESFEIFYYFQIEDGIPPSTQELLGASHSGGTTAFAVLLDSNGKLLIRYRPANADSRWDSTNAIMTDGVNGDHILRIRYDFEEDEVGVWLDGVAVPGSFVSGNMAALDPTTFLLDRNIYLGNINDGSPSSNPATNSLIRIAVTDLLTEQQAIDVQDYLTSFGTPAITPTIQATNLVATPFQTSIKLAWTGGNGTNKIVIGREGSAVNALPTNGISYTANPIFGSGSEIGTGNFVVHTGTSNNVTVTGLKRDTLYYFDVYEFNLSGLRYLTTLGSNTLDEGQRTDYINDQTFADYATDYTENQTVGFSSDVVNNELLISGDPAFWQDWISHNDAPGATLEEFKIGIRIRLTDDPDTDSAGIGIGIRNNLSDEANYAVVGELNLDTDHDSLGKVIIYSGNGTVNDNLFSFRSQSGTAIDSPAKDKQYDIELSRVIAGNDALWSLTAYDLQTGGVDPTTGAIIPPDAITTSWTESGRPSSQFFSTTTKFWIHVNGGDYAITQFYVRRLGDETTPPAEPDEYDVEVSVTGDDSNPGTLASPVRTAQKAFELAAAKGPGATVHFGPGEFVSNTFQAIPTNISLINGSGEGLTYITGGPNLYRSFTQNSTLWLWQLHAPGSDPLKISNLTLHGANRQIIGGISQKVRTNVTYENVSFNNFRFGGIWIQQTSDTLLTNCKFTSCGGTSSSGSYSSGAIILAHIDGLVIDGGYVDNSVFGTGYAFKTLRDASTPLTLKNLEIKNLTSTVHPDGEFIDASGNRISNINFEFFDNINDNVKIHDCTFIGGISISFGKQGTGATPGNTYVYSNTILPGQRPSGSYISAIEAHIDNLKVYDNYAACRSFIYIFNANSNAIKHIGWEVYGNYVEIIGPGGFGMGALVSPGNFPINATIRNNTLVYLNSTGQIKPPIFINNTVGGQSTLLVEDNAIYGQAPVNQDFFFIAGQGLTGSIFRNNKATHVNTLQTRSGMTGGSGQNNETGLNGSGWFNFSGAKPIPYYATPASSYLRNKGFGGDDVGAYQHE